MASIVRALLNPNYRLYFGGQIVSIIGNWMQQIALSWLIYRLTDSTLMLGMVLFAGQFPNLLLAPLGGVLSDRFPRRKLLMVTTSLSALQAGILAILSLTGYLQPPVIVVMALVLGMINGVDQPIRQSFIPELVERREDIANAVALTSFTIHSSRFIGPVIGGFVVATLGEAACFGLNALSYVGVLWALGVMRIHKLVPAVNRTVGDALREGIQYVSGHRAIRLLIFIVTVMALCSGSYQVLLPYFARDVFHGDVSAFGLMTAAAGLGACLGTIFLASRRSIDGMEVRIILFSAVVAVALSVFVLTTVFAVAIAALMVMGFCSINTVAASNALIQSLVEDQMRGRVMAIFSMAFFGITPVGNLLVGFSARYIGAKPTLLMCASVIGLMSFSAWRARSRIDFSLPPIGAPLGGSPASVAGVADGAGKP
ncbi:MAG: MFS transporter [Asticcacaulis sp.]